MEVRPVHIFLQLLSASLSAMSLLQCCWLRFLSRVKLWLLGVNVGGLGTLIASMASVISYKLFAEAYPAQVRHYLLMFLYYNVIGLFLLVPAVYFLMLY